MSNSDGREPKKAPPVYLEGVDADSSEGHGFDIGDRAAVLRGCTGQSEQGFGLYAGPSSQSLIVIGGRFGGGRRSGVRLEGPGDAEVCSSARQIHIPAGSPFWAHLAVATLLRAARFDVLIVDAYLDNVALGSFGHSVPDGVSLRLLGPDDPRKMNSVRAAGAAWVAEFAAARPLEFRVASRECLHDRFLIIDGKGWGVTQSLNHLAGRASAQMFESHPDATTDCSALWTNARPVALA